MSHEMVVVGDGVPYLARASVSKKRQLPITGGLPSSTANGVAISPDGSLCAVAHYNSPYLTVYRTSDWSKVTISSPPPGTANGVAFNQDGSLCAVAHGSSPYLTVYRTSDWSKVDHPFAVVPANSYTRGVAFFASSPRVIRGNVRDLNGTLVSRRVRVYDRTDGALCGSATSDPITGEYEVLLYEGDVDYDVQFMAADGENLNDLIYARTKSGAV